MENGNGGRPHDAHDGGAGGGAGTALAELLALRPVAHRYGPFTLETGRVARQRPTRTWTSSR